MKKILCLLISLLVVLSSFTVSSFASEGLKIYVNNIEIPFGLPPVIEDNRILVQPHILLAELGAENKWERNTNTLVATMGDRVVEMEIGKPVITVNGENRPLDVPLQKINGEAYVPLRVLAESLGAGVVWDEDDNSVYIYTVVYEYESENGNEVQEYSVFTFEEYEEAEKKIKELSADPKMQETIITVNGEEIKRIEIETSLIREKLQNKTRTVRDFADEIIERKVVQLEAKRLGIEPSPEDIDEYMEVLSLLGGSNSSTDRLTDIRLKVNEMSWDDFLKEQEAKAYEMFQREALFEYAQGMEGFTTTEDYVKDLLAKAQIVYLKGYEDCVNRIFLSSNETEADVNDPEIQKLFNDILNKKEFACYLEVNADTDFLDSAENMWGGLLRELFVLLYYRDIEVKTFTDDEEKKIVNDFISKCTCEEAINGLRNSFLSKGSFYNMNESLCAVYDGKEFDAISVDLFGKPLPEATFTGYPVGYFAFFLYNRVNLVYPYADINYYNVYRNKDNVFLFTKYNEDLFEPDFNDEYVDETKLIKATTSGDELNLYIYRKAEYEDYNGGIEVYSGIYKNTYRKNNDGYYWLNSESVLQ